MELKKITPGSALGFIDGLIEKIPEKFMIHIRRVFYLIGATILVYAVYFGAEKGYGSATQEGQELGKDTKTLFQEEIERNFNRKRKGVRMPDNSGIYEDGLHTIEKFRDSFAKEEVIKEPAPPSDALLNRDEEFRPRQSQGNTPPMEDISKGTTTYFTSPKDSFDAGYVKRKEDGYYTDTLKETPNNNHRILEKKSYKTGEGSLIPDKKKEDTGEKLLPMDN